jgi:hypothetical protein
MTPLGGPIIVPASFADSLRTPPHHAQRISGNIEGGTGKAGIGNGIQQQLDPLVRKQRDTVGGQTGGAAWANIGSAQNKNKVITERLVILRCFIFLSGLAHEDAQTRSPGGQSNLTAGRFKPAMI